MRSVRAVALATIMVVSMIGMGFTAAPIVSDDVGPATDLSVAQATGAPDGMAAISDDQIESDLPGQTPMGEAVDELIDHGVYASDHHDTLDVIVTNPGRAKTHYTGGTINGDGPIAIVFSDDEIHDGREVAISADVLEEILGYRAQVAFGHHTEEGDWVREIEYDGDWAVIEIPHFSTNAITFTGGISLSGEDATDGTTYTYTLDDVESVDNFDIEVSGVENTRWNNQSGVFGDAETLPLEVGGNVDPLGPGTDEVPVVELVGTDAEQPATFSGGPNADGSSETVNVDGDIAPESGEITFEGVEATEQGSDSGSVTDGSSDSLSVGGNTDPEDAEITFTGSIGEGETDSDSSIEGDGGSFSIDVGGTADPTGEEVTISPQTDAPEKQWEYFKDDGGSSIVYNDGVVYTGSWDDEHTGTVEAWDSDTGDLLWENELNSDNVQGLDYDSGMLIVATRDDTAFGLDASDGSEKWSQSLSATGEGATAFNGYGYVGNYDGEIFKFDLSTGNEEWRETLSTDDFAWSDALTNDGEYVYIIMAGDLYVVSESGGVVLDTDATSVDAFEYYEGELFAAVSSRVEVYDADNGDYLREYDHFDDSVSGVHPYEGTLFAGDWEEKLWAIDIETEEVYWVQVLNTGHQNIHAVYADEGMVFSWDSAGFIRAHEIGVVDPSVTIDGNTVSHSGFLDDSMTESIDLSTGSHTVDVSTTGEIQVDVKWTTRWETEDPAVTVNGEVSSYTGTILDGNSVTVDLSGLEQGSQSIDFSTAAGDVDWSADWREVTITEDPAVTIDGEKFSHTGKIDAGESETVQIGDVWILGSNNIEFGLASQSETDWTLDVDERYLTENPEININSDETIEYSHTGKLDFGETVTYEAAEIDLATSEIEYRTDGGTEVETNVRLEERTWTEDPVVNVNEGSDGHFDTLDPGETVSLNANPDWVVEGDNEIEISLHDPTSGPAGQVEFHYEHDAAGAETEVEYEGEAWSERYNFSNTWASETEDARVLIPFAGSVVDIRNLEKRIDGGAWEPISSDEYELDGTDLDIDLGSVPGDTTIDVRVDGSKIKVNDGEIQVLDPTVEGDALDTEFEIVELGPGFNIEVTDTEEAEWVHYVTDESWAGADTYARINAEGKQEVFLPEASDGSIARMTTADLQVDPETGSADVWIDDPEEPRFEIGPGASGGDTIELEWHDTVSGERYELYSVTHDRPVDTDTASSPVSFSTDDAEQTYVIRFADGSGGGGGVAVGPTDTTTGGLLPDWIWLFGAVVAALGGLVLITRGIGNGRERQARTTRERTFSLRGRDLSVPTPSIPRGDTPQTLVLVGGMAIIGLMALEFITPYSLFSTLLLAISGPGASLNEMLIVAMGIGLMVAIWYVDQITTESIPQWVMALAAIVTMVYIVETISPGALLGPVSEGFETVAPLFWLTMIAGGLYLARGWLRARRSPDQEVTFELPGNGGGR